jgi:excisionase family DNA binding protein
MNWLSPRRVAEKLDVSAKSVHRMLKRAELPHVVLPSGKKRISEEALDRFIKKLELKK